MPIQVDAVYEHGAFRPVRPMSLEDGTQVVLNIETQPPLRTPQALVAALAEIAALPAQSCDDGFSGADHDEVLYGAEGAL